MPEFHGSQLFNDLFAVAQEFLFLVVCTLRPQPLTINFLLTLPLFPFPHFESRVMSSGFYSQNGRWPDQQKGGVYRESTEICQLLLTFFLVRGKGERGKEEREEGEKEGRKREEGERKGKERGNGERFKSLLDERDELYIDYRPGPIHGLMCHDAAESPASMHASHGSLACHARRPVESPTTRLQITLTETHTLLDPASGSTSCTWPSGRRIACPMRRRGPCRSRRRPCLGSP